MAKRSTKTTPKAKNTWSPAARAKRAATLAAKRAAKNILEGNEQPLVDYALGGNLPKAPRKYTKKAPPGDARAALIEAAISLLRMAQNQS